MDTKLEQIVLCGPHARDYRIAGESIDLDDAVRIKDGCQICGALGWTYEIDRRKGSEFDKSASTKCLDINIGDKRAAERKLMRSRFTFRP